MILLEVVMHIIEYTNEMKALRICIVSIDKEYFLAYIIWQIKTRGESMCSCLIICCPGDEERAVSRFWNSVFCRIAQERDLFIMQSVLRECDFLSDRRGHILSEYSEVFI